MEVGNLPWLRPILLLWKNIRVNWIKGGVTNEKILIAAGNAGRTTST
jgi:hypothetical protein